MKDTTQRQKMKENMFNILKENDISTKNKSKHEINQLALQAIANLKKDVIEEVKEDHIDIETGEVLKETSNKFVCECGFHVTIISDTKLAVKKCSKCLEK